MEQAEPEDRGVLGRSQALGKEALNATTRAPAKRVQGVAKEEALGEAFHGDCRDARSGHLVFQMEDTAQPEDHKK